MLSYLATIQPTEILTEVEDNVKKFAQVILNEVIGLISPLKMQSAVDARDFNKLINSDLALVSDSLSKNFKMCSSFKGI